MGNARFTNRTAIITGASRGIGEASARLLASEGANVVLAARSIEPMQKIADDIAAAGGSALVVEYDALENEHADRLVDEAAGAFGGVDILVNNAGVLPQAQRSERISVEDWEWTMQINATAPWLLANRCFPSMAERGGGVVVNISSTAALYPSIGLSPYNASKAALTMASKAMAIEWARKKVRVVAVAPGKVATDLVQPILDYIEEQDMTINPLNRVAHPDEVAELIAYVASDAAVYMTGNLITLDGGEVAGTGADQGR